jgi:hypothetical protein
VFGGEAGFEANCIKDKTEGEDTRDKQESGDVENTDKKLMAVVEELLANRPDEGGHLLYARKKFSNIGKAC